VVPRIRAAMKTQGFDVPDETIVVFYHPRQSSAVLRRARRNAERSV